MRQERIRYLDSLRGIAAIAVVFQHVVETIISADPASRPILHTVFLDLLNLGWCGVALFFLIGGFVIPFSFKTPGPGRGFVISRFFRLYPAYWLSLAVALAIFPQLTGESFSIPRILANVTMVQAVFAQRVVIASYWTLFIELAFYALCVGLFVTHFLSDWRALIRAILAGLALSLAVAAVARLRGNHFPSNVALNLSLMFLGTLMRRAWLEQDMGAKRYVAIVIAICGAVVPVIQWLTPEHTDLPVTALTFCLAYCLSLAIFISAVKLHLPTGRTLVASGRRSCDRTATPKAGGERPSMLSDLLARARIESAAIPKAQWKQFIFENRFGLC